jgi:monoamine oxidase
LHFTLSKCNSPDYTKEISIYDLPSPSEYGNSTTYPKKFIWKVPLPGHMYYFSGQCVKLWNSKKEMLTQSAPFDLMLSKFVGVTDQDFVVYNAVEEYDNGVLPIVVDEAPKTVGIVGGGISGMFSALLLDRLNLGYKIEMHELKDRLGGRMESHRFYRKNSDGEEEEIAFCDLGAHFLPLFKYTVNGIKIDVNHDVTRKLINKLNYLNQNTSIPTIELIPVNNPPDISPMAHRGDDQYKDGIDNFVNAISLKMKNVHYHHNVNRLDYNDNKVDIHYKIGETKHNKKSYDYAIVSAPLTTVRNWELPNFSKNLTYIIKNQKYMEICHVGLLFNYKFWHNKETNDDSKVMEIGLYYKNTTMDGVTFPSYGDPDKPVVTTVESHFEHAILHGKSRPEETADIIIKDMESIFGDVVRPAYANEITVKCWHENEYEGGLADLNITEDLNRLDAYAHMEKNILFVGEHADFTHGWIAGAVASSIRAVTQILVKDGYIEEAKKLNEEWNDHWHRL